jgi:hypothetical protein
VEFGLQDQVNLLLVMGLDAVVYNLNLLTEDVYVLTEVMAASFPASAEDIKRITYGVRNNQG